MGKRFGKMILTGLLNAAEWSLANFWSLLAGFLLGGTIMYGLCGLFGCAESKPVDQTPRMGTKLEYVGPER